MLKATLWILQWLQQTIWLLCRYLTLLTTNTIPTKPQHIFKHIKPIKSLFYQFMQLFGSNMTTKRGTMQICKYTINQLLVRLGNNRAKHIFHQLAQDVIPILKHSVTISSQLTLTYKPTVMTLLLTFQNLLQKTRLFKYGNN